MNISLTSQQCSQLLAQQAKFERILQDDFLAQFSNVKQLYARVQGKIAAHTYNAIKAEIYTIPGIVRPAS